MPYSAGNFSLFSVGNPVVTGTTVSSTWANNTLQDMATGLSTCVLKDGTQTITGNIPMSSFKITGLAAGTTNGDSVTFEQLASTVLPYQPLATLTTKGDLYVATASATSARQGAGSDGQALSADSSQTNGVVYIDNPSRPNLLVNPNWQFDQINEGTLYTYSATTAVGPDGWSGSATGAGIFKLRTLADPDNAALKCLEITCTTADAAIAAGDNYFIFTTVEGYDSSSLMPGTSSAATITVQFKYKTAVTGVYGVAIQNSAANRRYIGIITVADTSEHEYSVSLTLDTSGTWLYTSGIGLKLILTLAAGSTFQSTSGAWAAGAEQTTSAQCNFMSANTNIAYLKRIQLIPGRLVQAYKAPDIQKDLAKAQRYYAKTFPIGTAVAQSAGVGGALNFLQPANAGVNGLYWQFPNRMRSSPTIVTYNPSAGNANWRDITGASDKAVTVDPGSALSDAGVMICANVAINISDVVAIHATASARLS